MCDRVDCYYHIFSPIFCKQSAIEQANIDIIKDQFWDEHPYILLEPE